MVKLLQQYFASHFCCCFFWFCLSLSLLSSLFVCLFVCLLIHSYDSINFSRQCSSKIINIVYSIEAEWLKLNMKRKQANSYKHTLTSEHTFKFLKNMFWNTVWNNISAMLRQQKKLSAFFRKTVTSKIWRIEKENWHVWLHLNSILNA